MTLRLKAGGVRGALGETLFKGPELAKETDSRKGELNKCREARANQDPAKAAMPATKPVNAAKQPRRASTRVSNELTTRTDPAVQRAPSASTKRNATAVSGAVARPKKSPCKPGEPDDPCRLRPEQTGGAAMDRLGGGSSSGAGSSAAGSATRPRASNADAATQSGSASGTGTAAPATSINRNAIGGGSERIR
jgi:hypothetical protein